MYAPVRTSAPATTPVSLNEVKAHCRVDGTDSDAVLTILLNAAVDHLDGWTGILGRALVTQTWRQDYFSFTTPLRLAVGPVASVTSVTYYDDTDNVQQTLANTVYALRNDAQGARLDLQVDQVWPASYARADAVSVTYVAGAAAADVPASIKVAILMLVSHWNENREAVTGGAMSALPLGVDRLIGTKRRMNI